MQIGAYFILIVVLIMTMVGILIMTHRQLNVKAAKEVFAAVLLVLFALLCFAISLLLTDPGLMFFFHEMKFLTLAFISPCTLFIYMAFADQAHFLTLKRKIMLCIVPGITVILMLTNTYHHFFRTDLRLVLHNGIYYIDPVSAWWYLVYTCYSYALFIAGLVVLIKLYYKKPYIYRGQIGLMMWTSFAAILVGIASTLGLYADYGDAALVSCAIGSILQYIVIVRYSPWRVVQSARYMIISDINNPVLIFDQKNALIDFNKSAASRMDELMPALIETPESVAEGEGLAGSVICLQKSDMYFRVRDKKVYDKHGQLTGRIVVLDDVTVLEKAARRLAYIAAHDDLTGLKNSQSFYSAVAALREVDLPAGIICLNISGMKLINAVFGNDYGDEVIVRVAQALQNENVECARLNGDEFGMILKNASAVEAEAFVAHINQKLFGAKDGACDIYLSGGVAVLADMRQDAGSIVNLAISAVRKRKPRSAIYAHAFMDTVQKSLARLYDPTGGRTNRITVLCGQVAKLLELPDSDCKNLRLLSVTHDIGLLSIPQELLQNIGNLTNEQWEQLKLHTMKGYCIALTIPALSGIADEILSHHERFDGYGYPNGRSGFDIPILARVLAAVEYFVDAPSEQAADMLQKRRGTQFDPSIVDAIVRLQG